jgi:hypothetical protein
MNLAKTVREGHLPPLAGLGVRVTAPQPNWRAVPRAYPERYPTTAAPAPNRERVSNESKTQVPLVFGLANRALDQPV